MRRITWPLALGATLILTACPDEGEKAPKAQTKAQPASAPAADAKKAAPQKNAATAKMASALEGVEVDDAAMTKAKSIYSTRCATCHGAAGAGDGPAAAALNPKPRSLKSAEWQKSVDDAHIATVIVKGGDAVGLSPMMAANPDLEEQPKVVKALVQMVRSFAE